MAVAENGRCARGKVCVQAHALELAAQHVPGWRVDLRLHQVRHQVHDVRLQAPVQKPASRLESKQSAADDRGALRVGSRTHDAVAIVQSPKHEDAVLEAPILIPDMRDGWNHRGAAGRDDERVVRFG